MDFLKHNTTAILGGVALLLAGYVYFAYFSGGSSSATLSSSDANTTLSQNLLVTLQNLHTIKLDNSIFSDPAFQSLTDFGVTIPPENVGRGNPFLPLGAAATSSNSTLILPPSTH
jgi:hypothetical protein